MKIDTIPGASLRNWGYSNYRITQDGNIYSINYNHTKKIKQLKAQVAKNGYGYVKIFNDNKEAKKEKIHRLVAFAFITNPDNKLCVNHLDGDKLNNNVGNLEWATWSENQKHAYRTGLKRFTQNTLIAVRKNVKKAHLANVGRKPWNKGLKIGAIYGK